LLERGCFSCSSDTNSANAGSANAEATINLFDVFLDDEMWRNRATWSEWVTGQRFKVAVNCGARRTKTWSIFRMGKTNLDMFPMSDTSKAHEREKKFRR